jgi:uncharacterized protein DUF222/HNH endonuclease
VDGVLTDLAETGWDAASDGELLAACQDIERWCRRLYGVGLAVTAELDTRRVAVARGASSTAVLLRQVLRIGPGEARRRVADAHAVCRRVQVTGEVCQPELPAAAQALAAGELSGQHLLVIRQTVHQLPPDTAVEDRESVESLLVSNAADLDPTQLVKVAQRIRAYLDPDGTLLDERQAKARRELSFAPDLDGTVVVRGRLDAEGAATVQAALDPLAKPTPADPTTGQKDTRTPARRCADALVQGSRMLLDAGDLPITGGQRPHLNVTIPLADLVAGVGVADLDFGSGLSAEAARRLACDAQVIPTVLGAHSEPLDVGRASYTVPAPMRRALIVRDRGCAFPGCDRPPSWCQAHHILEWANGGPTALHNLVLLCDHHHDRVHAQDWQIHIVNGRAEFTPPAWLGHTQPPLRNTVHHPPDTHTAA